jgi:16S rRNA (cytosine967-C5)-methyltransferase
LKKRLHRNIISSLEFILEDIFVDQRYADRVLEYHFKHNKLWGSRDRKFIAETTYELVRWWRRILYAGNIRTDKNFYKQAICTYLVIKDEYEIPEWLSSTLQLSHEKIQSRYNDPLLPLAIMESIPDWLDEIGRTELGDLWPKEIHALNQPAPLVLRVNTLKCSLHQLKNLLAAQDITAMTNADFPDALIVPERVNVFQLEAFKEGMFEVQDAGSQMIAPFLQIEPGMRIIDACAGAGGKSLHLAALMKNKGKILALDVEEYKLKELNKRSRRNGISIIETRVIDSTKVIKRQAGSADRLLLDVPCSGLGVLRRNPDAKWKLSMDFINSVRKSQAEILSYYSNMLKVGGKMVYATCSILPSENQKQVAHFISNHSDFILEEEQSIMPSAGFDGFYMARLRRQ